MHIITIAVLFTGSPKDHDIQFFRGYPAAILLIVSCRDLVLRLDHVRCLYVILWQIVATGSTL